MQLPKQPNIHYDFRNPESVAKAINLTKCDNPEQLIKNKKNFEWLQNATVHGYHYNHEYRGAPTHFASYIDQDYNTHEIIITDNPTFGASYFDFVTDEFGQPAGTRYEEMSNLDRLLRSLEYRNEQDVLYEQLAKDLPDTFELKEVVDIRSENPRQFVSTFARDGIIFDVRMTHQFGIDNPYYSGSLYAKEPGRNAIEVDFQSTPFMFLAGNVQDAVNDIVHSDLRDIEPRLRIRKGSDGYSYTNLNVGSAYLGALIRKQPDGSVRLDVDLRSPTFDMNKFDYASDLDARLIKSYHRIPKHRLQSNSGTIIPDSSRATPISYINVAGQNRNFDRFAESTIYLPSGTSMTNAYRTLEQVYDALLNPQTSIEQIPEELHEFVENSRDILAARDLERGIKPLERHAQQYWDFGDELSR